MCSKTTACKLEGGCPDTGLCNKKWGVWNRYDITSDGSGPVIREFRGVIVGRRCDCRQWLRDNKKWTDEWDCDETYLLPYEEPEVFANFNQEPVTCLHI